ncbi:MAG TPA: pyrrolo-quinoline quinone [Methylomirabilota bacterium]|nr:pyrrolo-quinoline quinone [Methylomirabilota bacterium]
MSVGCGGGGGSASSPQGIIISVTPAAASVKVAGTQTFTAAVTNASNTAVTWQVNGVAGGDAIHGSINSTGTYTAPAALPCPATVTVTAVSAADETKSASAMVTVSGSTPGGTASVSISPLRAALTTGQSQAFTATVTGNTVTCVTWEVDSIPGGNSSVGTVSATGVYSPPSAAGTHTVAARIMADSTASASASVFITDLAGVFTYHNDLSRDGVNSQEYALNTSTVKAATFGKRFACAIDASAYAQPLWVANVAIGGGTHNVLIAATVHDTLYAFDADASPCQTYWSKSLLASGETWVSNMDVGGSTDLAPDIGIVGTPVIDPATKTIYVVSKSKNGATIHQRLHALSLIDGSEKFTGPHEIAFTFNGNSFSPLSQNQRAGLALLNGVVYIAYASHGDVPSYFGWIVGYNAATLAQVSVFNDDPGVGFGGIWMAGGAPAIDSSNNLYVITGNGNFDGVTLFGDSFLKLSTPGLTVSSFFAPSDQATLDSGDIDFGSGGATILIDQPSGPVQHLAIGGGKEGTLFLLNRDNLGGNTSNDAGAVQTFSVGNRIFGTPAFWQNTLYIGPITDHVKGYTFNASTGQFSTSPASQSPSIFGFPGSTPSISSQGTSNGIVWATEKGTGPSVLHAYDATNLGSELWNSANSSADQAGQAVKFTVPTVANGKVYVGTVGEISVYGLLPN